MKIIGWSAALIVVLGLVVGICAAIALIDWFVKRRKSRAQRIRREELRRFGITDLRGTKRNQWES